MSAAETGLTEDDAAKTERKPSQLVHERLSSTQWGRRIRKEANVVTSDTEEWLQQQEAVMTRWINAKLANAPPPLPRCIQEGARAVGLESRGVQAANGQPSSATLTYVSLPAAFIPPREHATSVT